MPTVEGLCLVLLGKGLPCEVASPGAVIHPIFWLLASWETPTVVRPRHYYKYVPFTSNHPNRRV